MTVQVRVDGKSLQPEELRKLVDTVGCGSVVSFVGLTRGFEQGSVVERLEFEAWEEELPRVLHEIALQSITKFGVRY